MSYQTYTTEAVVCGTYRHNTDDCSYLLFTHDLGMVYATARSARAEKSRQRYALQDFSHIKVSLVKGKAGWRIGSVEALGNHFSSLQTRPARAAAVHIITLTRRLVLGEEPHSLLFTDCSNALRTLCVTEEKAKNISDLYTLRALWRLGYVKAQPDLAAALHETVSYDDVPTTTALHKAIEHGLSQSHL